MIADKTLAISSFPASKSSGDVNGPLGEFLDYVAGKPANDEYTKKVDAAVYKARQNKEWRREYMTLFMRDLENREMGIEEGIEQGVNKEQRSQIERLLLKGKSVDEIVELCGYPIELVKSVQESLLVTQ